MNILKIPREEILFVDKNKLDIKQLIEQFSIDQTSIFYVLNDNEIIGTITRKELPILKEFNLDKKYIFRFDHKPIRSEIIRIFKDNPTLSRISVFINNDFWNEYRNVDDPYIPKTINKNIIALRYIPFVAKQFNDWIKDNSIKKIYVLGNSKISNYLSTYLCTDIETISLDSINHYSLEKGAIFDFKYGKYLRMFFDESNINDLSSFIIKFVGDELIKHLNELNVDCYFIYDSVFDGMTCLSDQEKYICDNKISFDELIRNTEYVNRFSVNQNDLHFITNRNFTKTSTFYSGLTIRQTDITSNEINVKDGIRYSGPYLSHYTNEVHFYGPCSILGLCGPDEYTFEYQLQHKINENRILSRVFNHGVMIGDNGLNSLVECLRTPLRQGDVVFIYFMEKDIVSYVPRDKLIKMTEIFNANKKQNEICFFDVPGHLNRRGNEILTEYFFNILYKNVLVDNNKLRKNYFDCKGDNINNLSNMDILNPNMLSHFDRLKSIKKRLHSFKSIGSITMYASPFTKGHKYLVDYALNNVDAVIIFFVTENFHTLYSLDRLEILRANYQNIKNVIIIPTESYFASKQYFPEYSTKECNDDMENSSLEYQEEIFAKYVASYLNVTHRFMGEEPNDKVTSIYNNVVKKMCNRYGIKLHIIPRLELNGTAVSGTAARACINSKDFEAMEYFLTEETITYIKENEVVK